MKTLKLFVVYSVLLSIVGCSTRPPAPADSVFIAANLPLTGDLAVYGEAIQRGATLALQDLTQAHSLKKQLRFDWGDNGGSPQTAVTVMQRQLTQQPQIYVSALKPQTMAITDRISALGIPHCTWILDIAINPTTSNNFRVWVNFKLEAAQFLRYAKQKAPKRVAIVYVNTPAAAEEYEKVIAPGLRSMGTTDILIQNFDISATDFQGIAIKIKQFKADLIFLNGFIPHMIAEVRALRPYGLIKADNTVAGLDMLDTAPLLGKDEVEGIVVAAPDYLLPDDSQRVEGWKTRFRSAFGKAPTYHSAYAYDMVNVINDAAGRAPTTNDAWIAAIRGTTIQGLTGPIAFDSDGSLITTLTAAQYHNGVLQKLALPE